MSTVEIILRYYLYISHFQRVWAEILCNIANEELILDKCITHLIEIQARTIPFEEREDPSQRKVKGQPTKVLRYSCHVWLAAMNCLQVSQLVFVYNVVIFKPVRCNSKSIWIGYVVVPTQRIIFIDQHKLCISLSWSINIIRCSGLAEFNDYLITTMEM